MNNKLRDLFQQPFDLVTYRSVILSQLLHAQRLLTSPELLEQYDNGDQLYGLGYLTDIEGKEIGLYYTHVLKGDVRRKRVGFRKMLHPYVKYGVDAAIAVFDDGEYWRLSYICDLKGGVTSAKRFSYVFGDPKGQYNTPVGRLTDLAKKRLTLDELHKTFSVDALSKEFFDEYHRHYDRIIAELSRQGNTGAVFHDYVKKMMGRIVFLHFLQKKRWLNDDPEFLSKLFFLSPYKQDFLDQELEPLFFGIFNTEPDKREQLFQQENWDLRWLEEWEKLPYLNGGLFERDEVDKMKIKLPASLFEKLFEFMASYNFTIDENDPDDADIGIDPEMLGKIFESLLEDNKAKGAFYTPKEIVRYMCKESLIAYLDSKLETNNASEKHNLNNPTQESKKLSQCGEADPNGECVPEVRDLKQSIRAFVEQHELPEELEPYREVLNTALREVKICDPAIGSGAFPMGLLNELWRCREAIEGTTSRAALKKQIIENNIYGVDIERGAIDIARLRFWLSIVVDAEWNVNPDSGPEPLPNFDYKFMQGNSLIESFDGHDLSHIMESSSRPLPGRGARRAGWAENQTGMEFGSDEVKQNLRNWLKMYFSLTDHKEKAYYRELINNSVKNYIVQQGIGPAAEIRLNAIDPSANKHFFLWHTWFKDIFDKGGFDIVVGNPPYIRQELLGMDYKTRLIYAYPEVGNGIADICVYFFGLGISILNKNGVLSFITSNKFLKTKYGKELRHTLSTKVSVDRIIDFFELPVFNASTDAGITILFKSISQDPTRYYPIKTLDNLNLTDITSGSYLTTIKNDSEWQFIENSQSSILDKIKDNTTSLKNFTNNKIFRGITTGYNKAFVIKDYALAQRLLNSESVPIIKKYAQSTDIQMWGIKNDNKYFIATGYDTNIEQLYPTAFQYLKRYKDELESRCDKGESYYNLRACAYYEEFEKPKLIYIHTAKDHQFYFDTEGHYINNSCYMIVTDSKFLFCFLNSKLFKYYKRLKFVAYGDGQEAGRCKLDYNKMVTVPIKKGVEEKPFEELVEKIQLIKQSNPTADTSDLEHQIDKLIYRLYNLTPKEIAVIEQ